jgi:hypothetical protein
MAPMILCGGSLDPLVFFPVNTGVQAAWWQSLKVPVAYSAAAIQTSLVTVLDLETGLGPGDPFDAAVKGFAQAKQAVAAAAGGGTAGANAVVDEYHGYIVPPFCAAAVRGYFSQF